MPERMAAMHTGTSRMSGLERSRRRSGLFLLLAGYYVPGFYTGVLVKTSKLGASPSPSPAQKPSTIARG